jgi:hypothetical protein
MLYRKVAAARREDEIDRVLEEAADRYGPLPDSFLNLADYGRIRIMADRLGIEAVDREGRIIVIKFRAQAKIDPVRLVSLVRQRPDLTLAPPASLKLNLSGVVSAPGPRKAGKASKIAPSWWTARARETEMKPGFSKEQILGPASKDDPRAAGGVFARVGGLLSELIEEG